MRVLREWVTRFRGVLRPRRRDADLEEELRLHFDLAAEDAQRSGASREDAIRAARLRVGAMPQALEAVRDQRGWPAIDDFVRDLRYGVRLLVRQPGFTAAAVLSVALGIGVNTATFALLNLHLFQALPVADPDTLAMVSGYRTAGPTDAAAAVPPDQLRNGHQFSYPVFRELAERQRVFSGMAASGSVSIAELQVDGVLTDAADIGAGLVSANYFSLLGVSAALGRVITEADSTRPSEGAVAMIAYGLWERRFGRDPAIIGRTLTINRVPFTIVGVAQRGFHGERGWMGVRRDIWIPLLMEPLVVPRSGLERRTSTWFVTFARLAPGVTSEQAAAQLTVLYRQIKAGELATASGSLIDRVSPDQYRVVVDAGTERISNVGRQQMRQPLFLLFGVTVILLLITCCNVANLLIARGTARQREISIRLAIGSSRARLVRQLLSESLLLALVGAGLGVLLARWSGPLLMRLVGLEGRELDVDTTVLSFVAGLTLATTVLFGLLPAYQVTTIRYAPTALSAAFRDIGGAPRRRVARGLVIVQVALSLWLLIGAALLMRSLQNFGALDIGLDRDRVVLITLRPVRPIPAERGNAIQTQLRERISVLPGVSRVTLASYGLFGGGAQTAPVRVPDSQVDPARDGEVRQNYVSPGYFATLGMAIVRGRDFDDRDTAVAANVTVVNETLARHYFGDANPLGRVVYFPSADDQGRYIPFERGLDKARPLEIVGVVRDTPFDNLRDPVRRLAYIPIEQGRPGVPNTVLIRMNEGTTPLPGALRELIRDIEPDLGVRSIVRLEDQIAATLGQERTFATALSVFGGLALVLACVGLFGVMSYGVARRSGEIGVRIALGATPGLVVRLVLRETLVLALAGTVIGASVALATTGLLKSLLFGLTPTDPATIVGMVFVFVAIGLLAGAVPASRAARIDPVAALRVD